MNTSPEASSSMDLSKAPWVALVLLLFLLATSHKTKGKTSNAAKEREVRDMVTNFHRAKYWSATRKVFVARRNFRTYNLFGVLLALGSMAAALALMVARKRRECAIEKRQSLLFWALTWCAISVGTAAIAFEFSSKKAEMGASLEKEHLKKFYIALYVFAGLGLMGYVFRRQLGIRLEGSEFSEKKKSSTTTETDTTDSVPNIYNEIK